MSNLAKNVVKKILIFFSACSPTHPSLIISLNPKTKNGNLLQSKFVLDGFMNCKVEGCKQRCWKHLTLALKHTSSLVKSAVCWTHLHVNSAHFHCNVAIVQVRHPSVSCHTTTTPFATVATQTKKKNLVTSLQLEVKKTLRGTCIFGELLWGFFKTSANIKSFSLRFCACASRFKQCFESGFCGAKPIQTPRFPREHT